MAQAARTAWQPSAPLRRWCRSRRCRTGQTPRCSAARRSASATRWRVNALAWRPRRGAAGPLPFELGLHPGARPAHGRAAVCCTSAAQQHQQATAVACASGGVGNAPNLLLLLLSQPARRARLVAAVAVHLAPRGEPAGFKRVATRRRAWESAWGCLQSHFCRYGSRARAVYGAASRSRPSGPAAPPGRAGCAASNAWRPGLPAAGYKLQKRTRAAFRTRSCRDAARDAAGPHGLHRRRVRGRAAAVRAPGRLSRRSASSRAENPVAHARPCRALRRPGAAADGGAVDGEGPLDEPRIVVAADVAVEAPEREALNRLARPPSRCAALRARARLTRTRARQVELGRHYRGLERFAAAELAAPPDAPGASLCAPRTRALPRRPGARAHPPRAGTAAPWRRAWRSCWASTARRCCASSKTCSQVRLDAACGSDLHALAHGADAYSA